MDGTMQPQAKQREITNKLFTLKKKFEKHCCN